VSLDRLHQTVFETSLGPLPLWSEMGALTSQRPVVVTITSAFADPDYMSRMQQVLGDAAAALLMHLPGDTPSPLRETSIAAFARALGEVVAREFQARPVVLNGLGVGALVALAVRAAPVRRVIAVEPPLVTGKLWPMLGGLQQRLRIRPDDTRLHDFVREVFGVEPDAAPGRSYLPLLGDTTDPPADVVLGEIPLMPPRPLDRYPSLVDTPERQALRSHPRVTLHVAAGAGHNVPLHAPELLRDLLLAACGRAEIGPATARALVPRTPLDAGKLLYVGADAGDFIAAYAARNPRAGALAAADLQSAPAGPFDVLAAAGLAEDQAPSAVSRLSAQGRLIAAPLGDPAQVLAALEAAGLEAIGAWPAAAEPGHFDDVTNDQLERLRRGAHTGPLILALRRRSPAAVERLALNLIVYAPTLMDIRTRLPAQALRSEPEVAVIYSGPGAPVPQLPHGQPKVLILQRPAMIDLESWRSSLVLAIRRGWLLLLEYDDHPELVAQVKGRVLTPEAWARYGYPHAIQTSTSRLAELFSRYNPEVKVFGNAAFDIAPRPERPAPRRVFYGAVWRGDFAVRIARTLGSVAEAFPEVEFTVLGDRAVFDALPAARKTFHDYAPYERYLEMMGESAVSLSPIEGLLHQDTKSDAKFIDAASRGALMLGSPTIYAETVRHGETGLIAHRIEDWAPLLARALGDEPARLRMAQAAWTYVRDRRMFAAQIPERLAWYRDLWARRDALTAGVIARTPGLAEALAQN
jgi:hypothetical protein